MASEKTTANKKAEEQVEASSKAVEEVNNSDVSEAKVDKAAADLPIYDEEQRILKNHELRGNDSVVPDTPSGAAVKKVGNLDGEDVDHSQPGATEAARQHGESYQAEKRKRRWGY